MRVDRIFIDSYGERSNETLDFSQGNLRLIYGRNEAGKSTLLNFIRDELFGLPGGNDRSALFGGEIVGGSIEFRLQDGRVGKVSQKWSRVGKKSDDEFYATIRNLQTGADDVLDRDAFQTLLGGADRDLFARYFGFSHQELANDKALLDKSSLDRLVYGMILGGAERLEAVKSATSKRCDDLFRPTGRNQTINAALRRLKEAKTALRSAEFGTGAYKKAVDERDEVAARVVELKARCDEARENWRRWKTLDEARDVFARFCERQKSYDAFLARTPFDESTLARFDEARENDYARLKERRDALEDDLPRLESEAKADGEELRRLEASRSSIVDYGAQITSLVKRVELIGRTREEAPKLERDLKREESASLTELQALGLLALDATEEEIASTVASRRAPILESVFDEIDGLASEEGRLDAKFDELKGKINAARADLERRTQEESDARRELTERFGAEPRAEDAKELESVVENFALLKKEVGDLSDKERELDALRAADDAKSRTLVAQLYGSDVDDATLRETLQTLGAQNVAPPLNAEFDALKSEDDSASAKIDELQRESDRLGKEIEALDLELQRAPQDVASAETLRERRDERRELWNAFKNDLLTGKKFERSELEGSVAALERLTREIDATADRRYERAELLGKLEERRRKRDDLNAQKTKVDADLDARQKSRVALQERAGRLWRRVGLERCAALSIAAGREWLDAWTTWRGERAEILRRTSALEAAGKDVGDRLRAAFEVASRWAESEPFKTNSIDEAVCFVEKTLKNARTRLEEYRKSVGEIEAQRLERIKTARNLADCERESKQTEKERGTLNSRLDEFCLRRGYERDVASENPCALLKATLLKLREWQKKRAELDERREKLREEEDAIKKFETRVDALKNALRETLLCERAEEYVANWERRLNDAQKIEDELNVARKSYATSSRELQTKRETAFGFDAKLSEIFAQFDVAREEFASFREDAKSRRELKRALDQESRILREKLGGEDDEDFKGRLEELTSVDAEIVKENCERFKREVAELERRREEFSARRGELEGKLKTLESEGNPAALNSRRQEALSALREAVDVYVPTLFARRALEESLRICKEEKIPEILGRAREIFQSVVSGRYSNVEEIESTGRIGRGAKAEKEGFGFRVFERGGGTAKTTEQLSSGTREQLYLALRLAHIRQYCQQAEPLPIWADDALLSASCDRVGNLIGALKNFADEGYQVVLSTCQLSTRRAFEKIVGEEFVTVLKPRKIKK